MNQKKIIKQLDNDSVRYAKNLYKLEIISIPIIRIPDYIRHISNLEDLVLRDSGLKEFDELLLELDSLEWLDLRGNKELRIDQEIRDLLYKKLKLFNPPEHYSFLKEIK